jgi:hypothetical protein
MKAKALYSSVDEIIFACPVWGKAGASEREFRAMTSGIEAYSGELAEVQAEDS